jgi:transcriptional regulator with XRE-family HTH domain
MTSNELFAEFQSLGTVHEVPDVRKITVGVVIYHTDLGARDRAGKPAPPYREKSFARHHKRPSGSQGRMWYNGGMGGPPRNVSVEPIYWEIGARIQKLREARGINQSELARRIDHSRTGLIAIEAGRCRLVVHHVLEIAAVLDVDPMEILSPRWARERRKADPKTPGWQSSTSLDGLTVTTRKEASESPAEPSEQC